jgi:DNA-binding transcriptional LysR family regulator
LGLNTSTVSRRIAALEASLAARLVERHPEGIKLTKVGEDVRSVATQLNDQVRGLLRRVNGRETQLAGSVRLTAAEIVGPLLCSTLAAFTAEHPAVELELTVTDAMLSLERHAVDVAVRVADAPPPELIGKRAGVSAVGLYASKTYLAAFGRDIETEHHAWIAWPKVVDHKPAFRWIETQFPNRRQVIRASSANGVLQAVQGSVGIAPLACAQTTNDGNLVLLRKLPATCSTPVWVLTHSDSRNSARVRALSDHLYAALRAAKPILEGTD